MSDDLELTKLEDSQLWRWAVELAEYAYGSAKELPEDEEWGLAVKLKGRAMDATADIAEGVGSLDPHDKLHYFGNARRELFSLKNSLIVAKRTGLLHPDEGEMAKLDKALERLDGEIRSAQAAIATDEENDFGANA